MIKTRWRSCENCYYKVNRPICSSMVNGAATCPDFRPAKPKRAIERNRGGS